MPSSWATRIATSAASSPSSTRSRTPSIEVEPAELLEPAAVLLTAGAARVADDEHVEIGVQALGRAPRATQHPFGVGPEGAEGQQPLGDRLRADLLEGGQALLVAPRQGRSSLTSRLTSTSSATCLSAVSRSAERFSILKKLLRAAWTRSGR